MFVRVAASRDCRCLLTVSSASGLLAKEERACQVEGLSTAAQYFETAESSGEPSGIGKADGTSAGGPALSPDGPASDVRPTHGEGSP